MGLSKMKRLLENRLITPLRRTTIAAGIAVILLLSICSSFLPGINAVSTNDLNSETLQMDDDSSSTKTSFETTQEPIKQESTDSMVSGDDPAPDSFTDEGSIDTSYDDSESDSTLDDSSSSPTSTDTSDDSESDNGILSTKKITDDKASTIDYIEASYSTDTSKTLDESTYNGTETENTTVSIYTFETIQELIIENESKIIDSSTSLTDNDTDDGMVSYVGEIGLISENNKISVRTAAQDQTRTIIRQVDFTTAENKTNVTLKVKQILQKPAEVISDFSEETSISSIYQYLDIKLTANDEYIGESGISSMTFTFEVNMSWIKYNQIDISTILMMRYHNDTWHMLNTTLINETTSYIVFQAETPGLSIFAVVGDQIVEDSDEIVKGSIQLPWWTPVSLFMFSIFALGIFLVKKRYIYLK